MKARVAMAALGIALLAPTAARADEPQATPKILAQPDLAYETAQPRPYPSLPWILSQLVPSPELAVGRVRHADQTGALQIQTDTAFGLGWQVTPLLWSWGVHRKVHRFRYFVVDPLARVSGSLELDTSFEYFFGHVDRMLVRPGVRANFPLVQRGEYLSLSIGTSTYKYDDMMRVAYDAGAYVLFGTLGAQITIAPAHNPLQAIATFRIRFF